MINLHTIVNCYLEIDGTGWGKTKKIRQKKTELCKESGRCRTTGSTKRSRKKNSLMAPQKVEHTITI